MRPQGRLRVGIAAAVLVAGATLLAGCLPDEALIPKSASPTASDESSAEPTPSATPTSPTMTMPKDCREILSDDVLAELDGVPLNDPAFGESGMLSDGSLRCIWGDPAADTTGLTTTIEPMWRGEALDMLNALVADEGFSCYTPDDGTRCEKTWPNKQYPVTDGRTLFWRDGLLIDTRYSNLAPSGYTSAIIAAIWP
ncbi:hypothetical protein [Microbacterium alcoholitolerans]|uniref:hypothetical protein n=1 Tax=unclassified Microbacterium TaxID=2609290 RepID=UPI003D16F0C9